MFLTLTQLKDALRIYQKATRDFNCKVSRTDIEGRTERMKKAPPFRAGGPGSQKPCPYGPHGAAFVQVDPITHEIRCGACAGELDATVKE